MARLLASIGSPIQSRRACAEAEMQVIHSLHAKSELWKIWRWVGSSRCTGMSALESLVHLLAQSPAHCGVYNREYAIPAARLDCPERRVSAVAGKVRCTA